MEKTYKYVSSTGPFIRLVTKLPLPQASCLHSCNSPLIYRYATGQQNSVQCIVQCNMNFISSPYSMTLDYFRDFVLVHNSLKLMLASSPFVSRPVLNQLLLTPFFSLQLFIEEICSDHP